MTAREAKVLDYLAAERCGPGRAGRPGFIVSVLSGPILARGGQAVK
jgi:hypothetical protein